MRIPILLYHHVDEPPPAGTPSRSNYVKVKAFSRQMHMLKRLGFQGLSLKDAAPYLAGEKHGKIAVITFDDGFASVYRHAMPVLDKLGFTATCFFVTRQINGENEWDSIEARRVACMTTQQVQEWAEHGHEIASHTIDHVHLAQIEPDDAQCQISQSKKILENTFGTDVISFAYPYGSMNKDVRDMAEKAGYTYAVTTKRGRFEVGTDLFDMPRHSIRRNDYMVQFLLKCLFR